MAVGEDQEAPSLLSLRREARTIYGSDAPGYDAGRPDYPAEVYDILAERCGLRAGASVVEIGAGGEAGVARAVTVASASRWTVTSFNGGGIPPDRDFAQAPEPMPVPAVTQIWASPGDQPR